jgi:hypothetical protein
VVTPWVSSSVLVFVLCLCSFVGCRGVVPHGFCSKKITDDGGLIYIAQHVDRTVVIEEE